MDNEWTRLTPEDAEVPTGIMVAYLHRASHKYPHVVSSRSRHYEFSDAELLALATVTGVWREVDEVKELVGLYTDLHDELIQYNPETERHVCVLCWSGSYDEDTFAHDEGCVVPLILKALAAIKEAK